MVLAGGEGKRLMPLTADPPPSAIGRDDTEDRIVSCVVAATDTIFRIELSPGLVALSVVKRLPAPSNNAW